MLIVLGLNMEYVLLLQIVLTVIWPISLLTSVVRIINLKRLQ